MIKSHSRGHEIVYKGGVWVYSDNGKPVDEHRPCAKCGCMPTKDGHDACLGYIEGVSSACCGHGIDTDRILMYDG